MTKRLWGCAAGICDNTQTQHHPRDCEDARVRLTERASATARLPQGAAYDPLDRVAFVHEAIEQLDEALRLFVADARAAGESWARIGSRLGVTKQAAVKRFGEKRPAPVETGPGLF